MARPKKIIVEETPEKVVEQKVVTPKVEVPKFDPSIPENKQRGLR